MYGYRVSDGVLPIIEEGSGQTEYKLSPRYDQPVDRMPMMVSLGCHSDLASLPHPDCFEPETALAGCGKRISAKLPAPDDVQLGKLKRFIRSWLEKRCTPLAASHDLTFDTWLKSKGYPKFRKGQLIACRDAMVHGKLRKKYVKVKCFIKDENYTAFKHARGIFSRADEFKVFFGPICSAIEDQIYKQPEFIKHIPVKDRPAYIRDFIGRTGFAYGATDYTSFESSFSRKLMKTIDFELFKFFLKNQNSKMFADITDTLGGENICSFKWFTIYLKARRMSGEMNTSLCNGFANLMVMMFLCEEYGYGEPRMVVEGDDGLTMTPSGRYPSKAQFAELGFNIKIERHALAETASFCGIVSDPEELINVTDVKKVLAQFGWGDKMYAHSNQKKLLLLLRCKSYSYLYQYPGCPIIQELALYGLRMTRSYDIRGFVESSRSLGEWERRKLREALQYGVAKKEIKEGTRLLVEKLYGVSKEMQLHIEKILRETKILQPLNFDVGFDPAWEHFSLRFVRPLGQEPQVMPAKYRNYDELFHMKRRKSSNHSVE